MSETFTQTSFPSTLRDPHPGPPPHFRARIGADPGGGYYPAAHRYHLYLSLGCPLSLRVSITLGLLGLEDSVSTTFLPSPAGACDALTALRTAYETTWHHYDGPLTVPALCDVWSGRVVSNHTPDILDDLALHFTDQDNADLPRLRPAALAADIDAVRELLAEDLAQDPALDLLERQLASQPYVLGEMLTAADVDLWVALVHLDADAVRRVAARDRLWSYVRRLGAHPAFHDIPRTEGKREHSGQDLCSSDKDCVVDQSRVTVLAGHECQRQALAC
ncbi:glutathione S-transferase C-terminal domain-containing protein [Actinacidiphila oryziradicis]|uniref:glutathione S-transferase C-terminal domain-containing protein n=1 Tax=Actinacidiphila oryziradicis TaxID=2571141 RepID=UPI00145D5B6E|nr:glutathione S-transferase C-terminal domain-containing protein [Actinacidiphila oryziradicis]